jgi:hypothetical protein
VPSATRLVGFLLALLGLVAYALTGFASMTALIPAFFGVIFIVLALAARSESARKHAMHIAIAIALLGLFATLARVVPAVADGAIRRPAVIAQLLMAAILAAYVALGIKSFVDARRARA